MTAYLDNALDTFNQINLNDIAKKYENFVKERPSVDKIIILANHILRLLPMIALMQALPFTALTNAAVMIVGAIFYRVTIEKLCPLRFALLSSFGAIAYDFAKLNANPLGYVPLAIYAISVIHTSLNSNTKKPGSCRA